MTLSRRTRRLATLPALALAVAAVTAGVTTPTAAAAPKDKPKGPPPVELQLLALNDFHGQLEPPTGSSSRLPGYDQAATNTVDVFGGVEYLATQVRQLEAASKQKNTLTVAAGDLIGATPLLSAAFHDEPAIEALNLIGLDYASVGNHEFDEGAAELLRIQNGGCHPVDGCADPALPYRGADFQYLSANAFVTASQRPLLPPYAIHKVQGVKVGFIGMTLEGTPSIVTPSGVAGLEFRDEAKTANRYAAELRRKGVETIVVLLHEGGSQTPAPGVGVDSCTGLNGPITSIVPQMDDAIDVVVTGHTHQAYNCVLDGKVVTSASSVGRLVTDIDLTIDRRTGDVLTAAADNVPVVRTVAADPAQTALIARYRRLIGPIANEVVGTASAPITRAFDSSGENSLGNFIADAQLAATRDKGAVAALMNPGGVRADLEPGDITFEEAFSVQPFGNFLSTITLTGAQLECVLEQQFVVTSPARVLLPSASLTYTIDASGTVGSAANPCSGTKVVELEIGGTAVDPAASYRITVNNFLADGGDGFTQLRLGTNRVNTAGDDLDAFVAYLTATSPVGPPATDRIAGTR